MTQTMKQVTHSWRRRTGVAAVGAAVAISAILGPTVMATSRLGASETVSHATVSAADTITSRAVLAEVAGAGKKASQYA